METIVMIRANAFLSALLLCAATSVVHAQAALAPKKTLEATRIAEKINIDAQLDEPAWVSAAGAADFLFLWPTPGNPATQKSVVKVLYDDDAMYIGAHLYDTHPDSIFHRITKRDAPENSDLFSVIIDTYRDGQNAVQFGVTPDNVQYDNKYSLANADPNEDNADGRDPAWDAVWFSATRITDDGWMVELQIPYAAIRFPKTQTQDWSINFFRAIRRRGETDSWNEVKAEITGTLNQMGILTGIHDIKAPVRLSATPFVAAYADNLYNQPGSNWSFPYSIGMDVKYGLNEAFTLDATVIPDFGQVRSDQQVLNLSPFEVRFQENRPFFTEGTELFNKGGLFYSRRIGGLPIGYWSAYDQASENETVVENPNRVQLINATKISGRTDNGLGVGIFNAIEAPTHAVIENNETKATRKIQTSPLTNRSIFVLDQNLKNNSSLTFLNTNVFRSGSETDANVSALMLNLKNKAQSYAMSGRAVMSNRITAEGEDENGFSTTIDVSKTSGNFLWGATYAIESDRYNPRDMGFLFSANESSGNAWINYSYYKPWWKLNNFWTSLWVFNGLLYKPAGAWTETAFGWNFGFNTRSFHNFGVNINTTPWGEHDYFEPRTDDFVHFYKLPASGNFSFWYNSDHRKKLVFNLNAGYRDFAEPGRRSTRMNAGVRWRASGKLTIGFNVGNQLAWQNVGYITPDASAAGYEQLTDTSIVFGHRDIVGFDNQLELNYSFTNRMNLAMYTRHYWNRVHYNSFEDLMYDGTLRTSAYTGASDTEPHLNNISANYFNIDLVFTWRFAPGSDILLVYKNGIAHSDWGMQSSKGYFYNARHLTDFAGSNSLSMKILYFLDYTTVKKQWSAQS